MIRLLSDSKIPGGPGILPSAASVAFAEFNKCQNTFCFSVPLNSIIENIRDCKGASLLCPGECKRGQAPPFVVDYLLCNGIMLLPRVELPTGSS
jgi:hypothetical protein